MPSIDYIEIRIPELAELQATVQSLHTAVAGLQAPAQPRKYLDAGQAAEYLGVSPKTIRAWTCAQSIPFARLSGGCVRYDVADLDKWIERKKTGRWPEKS